MSPQMSKGDNFQTWRDREKFAKNRRNTARSERHSLVTKPNCTKVLPDPFIGDWEKNSRVMIDEGRNKKDEHTTTKSVQTI